jgi:hypothetical protein
MRWLSLFVMVWLPLELHAAPTIQGPMNEWQTSADLKAKRAEAAAASAGQMAILDRLSETLAAQFLVPVVESVSFAGADDALTGTMVMGYETGGGAARTIGQLKRALGEVKGAGDTVCLSTVGGPQTKMTIPRGADHALLAALGTRSADIEPVPYIQAKVGEQQIVLSAVTLGAELFHAIESKAKAGGSIRLHLEVDGSPVLNTEDVPVAMSMSTTTGQTLKFPVELQGVPTTASRLPSQTVWRISGVSGTVAYAKSMSLHSRLASIFIKKGRITLSDLTPTIQYRSRTAKVSAGAFEVHFLGDNSAWYGKQSLNVKGLMTLSRTAGDCDIAVEFGGLPQWRSKASVVLSAPMPAEVWRGVRDFRIMRVGDEHAILSFLNGPDCPVAKGGISNRAFDEIMARSGQCRRWCGSTGNGTGCERACMESIGFRRCISGARDRAQGRACMRRRPRARSATSPAPSSAPDRSSRSAPSTANPGVSMEAWMVTKQDQCRAGDALSCYAIGARYAQGKGMEKNPVVGLVFIERACGQDMGQACYVAGQMHERGVGTAASKAKASESYEKACKLGYPAALSAGVCE